MSLPSPLETAVIILFSHSLYLILLKEPNQEHDLVPKPSNITIKLPKKKPEQFVPPVMQQQQQQPEAVIPPQYDAPLVRGRFGNSAEDSIRSTTDRPPRKSRFSDVPDSSLEPEVGKR